MIKNGRRLILFGNGRFVPWKLLLLIILTWIMMGQSPLQPSENPNLVIRFGHSGPVYDASFSPDGRFVVTASQDTEPGVQQPSLFDFRRSVTYETLIMRLGD